MEYNTLEQRMISSFKTLIIDFHGCENNNCSLEEQKNLYDFILNFYDLINDEPTLLYENTHSDYSFKHIFNYSDGDPLMAPLMRKIRASIINFMNLLIDIGKGSILKGETFTYNKKVSSKIRVILEKLNITITKEEIINQGKPFFKALQWLSKQVTTDFKALCYCWFDPNYDYMTPSLASKIEKEAGATKLIIDWLKENHYKLVKGCSKYPNLEHYIVNYIKTCSKKEAPLGFAYMGDKVHIGFSMEYRFTGTKPAFCSIRIQNMDIILKNFSSLSSDLQDFILSTNKRCDQCNYCIQLDKTKTKPRAFKIVNYKEENYNLCPLFQGFWYSFCEITKEDAKKYIEFMKVIEKYSN